MAGRGRRRAEDDGRAKGAGAGRRVVVVESPTKAKTLSTWLGAGNRVIATRGHVRNLPAKAGSVDPADGFAMTFKAGKGSARTLGAIARALAKADALVLATDPDREGEAIAWQVVDWLEARRAIGERRVERAAFHEVTEAAVRAALANPRTLDLDLVRARRALDYWWLRPTSRRSGSANAAGSRFAAPRERTRLSRARSGPLPAPAPEPTKYRDNRTSDCRAHAHESVRFPMPAGAVPASTSGRGGRPALGHSRFRSRPAEIFSTPFLPDIYKFAGVRTAPIVDRLRRAPPGDRRRSRPETAMTAPSTALTARKRVPPGRPRRGDPPVKAPFPMGADAPGGGARR